MYFDANSKTEMNQSKQFNTKKSLDAKSSAKRSGVKNPCFGKKLIVAVFAFYGISGEKQRHDRSVGRLTTSGAWPIETLIEETQGVVL